MAKVGRSVTDPRAGTYCQITLEGALPRDGLKARVGPGAGRWRHTHRAEHSAALPKEAGSDLVAASLGEGRGGSVRTRVGPVDDGA
jgi:hypothetical protein